MTLILQTLTSTGWQDRGVVADPRLVDLDAPEGSDTRRRPRRIVDSAGDVLRQNTAADLYAAARTAMDERRARPPRETGSEVIDRWARDGAEVWVVTVLDEGASPDARKVYRATTAAEAVEIYNAHRRAILYACRGLRERFMTPLMMREIGHELREWTPVG